MDLVVMKAIGELDERIIKLEKDAHEPFDFSQILERLDNIEAEIEKIKGVIRQLPMGDLNSHGPQHA